ncbi:type II toxin-antitoxin system PemK/MazF family toxin [Haloterrigena alkaliphila]|uniref:Type II toxin-antitoxin system PemK/MazF family toxin n=1 Tax=Haloterrigena alkaliphila TaxID=2816475 RepID=A0A8A2V797_9EURY|nr:type II toxin-antitoxin system PemK/MazF family toxin [Haloterrigena alkaliphila]QSW97749.1 type II toxin-antitoxin system PemK/MazF family toxin [Haloterrigena alkaliphila]
MSYGRGDVVIALDPFKKDSSGRPFLIVSDEETPFHEEQYIALSLTTKTWYEERISLSPDDWVKGGAPQSSSIMSWYINSIDEDLIKRYQGRIRDGIVEETTAQLSEYVHD